MSAENENELDKNKSEAREKKQDVIVFQTSPDGDYKLLSVICHDEKGKPWICEDEKGGLVWPNGEPLSSKAIEGLTMLGAIGD